MTKKNENDEGDLSGSAVVKGDDNPGEKNVIVLCSDGTWNRGGPGAPTNVWRIHQAIDRSKAITVHDNGVGTEDHYFSKFLGGAFGVGLYPNVADLYAFLIRHYKPDMKIYLFGFSRGAFTVRLLSGVIGMFGVVDRDKYDGSPEEAAKKVVHAFRLIHAQEKRGSRYGVWWVRWSNWLLGREPGFKQFAETFRRQYCHPYKETDMIHFLGVWDTVRAIAGPFDPLVRAANFIFCISFDDNYLSKSVSHGYQALAADENRLTFAPIPWETHKRKEKDEIDPRVHQEWFAGCHSDIGGGYAKQGLPSVSLDWMMTHAELAGLPIDSDERARVKTAVDPHCALHNPRVNKGLFYRYKPRRVPADATIHESLTERIEAGTNGYAPCNLKPKSASWEQAPFHSGWIYEIRSWAHAIGLGSVLFFIAMALLTPLPQSSGPPAFIQSVLSSIGSWITSMVPGTVFDDLFRRPIDVLQGNRGIFWGLFGVLLASLAVSGFARWWMEKRATTVWEAFRKRKVLPVSKMALMESKIKDRWNAFWSDVWTSIIPLASSLPGSSKGGQTPQPPAGTGKETKWMLVLVSLGLLVIVVALWELLNLALFTELTGSIHHYYLHELWTALSGAGSERPFIFGHDHIADYLSEDWSGHHTALDFLFLPIYGTAFLLAFRTLLLGYPKHLEVSARWCFFLFGLPLSLALFADLMENVLLLYLRSIPDASPSPFAASVAYFTLAKTCLLVFVPLSLIGLSALVLRSDKKEVRVVEKDGRCPSSQTVSSISIQENPQSPEPETGQELGTTPRATTTPGSRSLPQPNAKSGSRRRRRSGGDRS